MTAPSLTIIPAREIDTQDQRGWIVDLSPADGPIDPDCWYRFTTRKSAKRFLLLLSHGRSAAESYHYATTYYAS
jgi:hypothetical protein